MAEAHQHTRPPTDVEHEICEAFTRVGIDPADCRAYARAKADRCLDCQDRLLAEAAADPDRAGVLYHFFYVAIGCHFGENAIGALSYRMPVVGPVATKVAAAEVNLWGESTVPTADAVACAQTVLAEFSRDEREACLQGQANLAVSGEHPLLRAMTEANLDDRVDMNGEAHWIR